MKYISAVTGFNLKNTCVTMGKFDGMHRGHQYLFNELYKSEAAGLLSVVFTFDVPPADLFSGNISKRIYTEEEKRYFLEKKGIYAMISFPFTRETAGMEPEHFIEEILVKKLDVKKIVVGEDFHFGKERKGSVDMLNQLGKKFGYTCLIVPKLKEKDVVISSTLIRQELEKGNIAYANKLLGSPFKIRGIVEHGKQIGRKMGMPTLNIIPKKIKLLPPNGVYATKTYIQGVPYLGVSNIGCKPTVTDENIKTVESHLFNFNGEVYDMTIETEFFDYERPEYKFNSIEELSNQMHKDINYAKEYFKNW